MFQSVFLELVLLPLIQGDVSTLSYLNIRYRHGEERKRGVTVIDQDSPSLPS